jgi:HNH endonuclease
VWKVNAEGETWEYVYFIKSLKDGLDIPYATINAAAGYAENNVIQGFQVLSDQKSAAVLAALDLSGDNSPVQPLVFELSNIAEAEGAFDAGNEEDGRRRELASIVRRQGQPKFRRQLLELYENSCAISGCDALHALEAAHIIPYNGDKTNHPCNGLLLRSDLHTLFDLGLLTVDANTLTVTLSPLLRGTTYASFAGQTIRLPKDRRLWPSAAALAKHNSFVATKTTNSTTH